MFAQALAQRLSRAGVHYGWAVVAIVFLMALTTAGCMGIAGALIQPLRQEFGWSTEETSGALALRIVLFGLMAPFTAALIDKYGFRRVVLAALALIEIGLLGALVMTRAWRLMLFWGVVVGLGAGLTAMVLGAIVATRSLTERRGLAIGILTASSASGQLVFLPLAAWLADRAGWRFALAPPIVALVLVAILAAAPPTVRLTAEHFGRERTGGVYGWVFASHMIGAAVAAWAGGFSRSAFETYLPAFYGAGFACLIAAASIWLIGGRQGARERLVEAPA